MLKFVPEMGSVVLPAVMVGRSVYSLVDTSRLPATRLGPAEARPGEASMRDVAHTAVAEARWAARRKRRTLAGRTGVMDGR